MLTWLSYWRCYFICDGFYLPMRREMKCRKRGHVHKVAEWEDKCATASKTL